MRHDFLKDGHNMADIVARLNLCKDPKNWLSMQPDSLKDSGQSGLGFEEVNGKNRLNGRGIRIYDDGAIYIGYFENG